ncbi:tyrosine-type recombinase/integrase [Burkholderia aenigmatica]|uniref:tyrosine-type recombinase/integrase n=1 Tax=Burkholderia aenigmatica TaxID=2015348 RepID=UPI002650D2F2|nr:hypothetical protein [Burkholderia aenigmatica]MDN7881287.1 hypothetical protein [Burkholderia aenigmatica]
MEERKRARASSFAKVAHAYLAEIKPVFALSSYRTKESRMRKYLSPLSPQANAVLKDLQRITGGERYLFPHRTAKGFTTPNRLTYAMRDMSLVLGTTPHCWRTTFSTWANENGYRPDAIGRQLAHIESNKVRTTYNKALLLADWKLLMQAWADYLSDLAQSS